MDCQENNTGAFDLVREAKLLFGIAIPAVAVSLFSYMFLPMTAAAVGHLGTEELAGFSLGSLTGNLTCLSVMVGALTAADTLMPRAFGMGRYAELGRLAIRGFSMCAILLIPPILPLCVAMIWVFDSLGQDPYASELAQGWIRAYLLGVPALLLFRVIQSFLNAQHVVMPLVWASAVACFLIHPIMLKVLIPALGFEGSAIAIAITNTLMVSMVVLFLRIWPEHKLETFPGLTWEYFHESIRPEPMLRFLKLSLGGVFALSEWWFWETNCFIVGSFGVVPLCVHTIAYNLVPLLFMVPLGIAIGLTVRMGTVLACDVPRAKKMAAYTMGFTVVVGAVITTLLYQLRVPIVRLFTNDEEVLQGCQDIWGRVCFFIFTLYAFGINSAILRALGLQWHLAAIVFTCLWLFALPATIVFAVNRGGGIEAVWWILPLSYTSMQVLLVLAYTRVDWQAISDDIHERTQKSIVMESKLIASEKTPLMTTTNGHT